MKLSADRRSSLGRRIIGAIKQVTGLPESQLLPLSDAIVYETLRALSDEYAGERIYIAARDPDLPARIRSEFNGRNRDELMRKHDISKVTFYSYIGQQSTRSKT